MTPELILRLVAIVAGTAMAIVGGFVSRGDDDSMGWPLAIFGGFIVITALTGPEVLGIE